MAHAEITSVATITTTTETSAGAIEGASQVGIPEPGIVPPPIPALIRGLVVFNAGLGSTGATIRCRQGIFGAGVTAGLGAATPIGQQILAAVVASANNTVPFEFFDPTGVGAATGYSITVQLAGATGNGGLATLEVNMEPQLWPLWKVPKPTRP